MPTLVSHWPEYVIEACCLAIFMLSAMVFAVVFQHPASPLAAALPHATDGPLAVVGRLPMGVAMGLTAAALIYSPFGRRSGAHMNPAVTLAFLRLGRIGRADALAYIAAQFAGGITGVAVAVLLLRDLPSHPAVNYVATMPGAPGTAAAFAAEAVISALLILAVLTTSASPRLAPCTGAAAATLVALFITVEAPLSGMSMNPARTLASAIFADSQALWIYFVAPPLGMLAATELVIRIGAAHQVRCAKLHHDRPGRGVRCIFPCGHMETAA
jgi:aquaporin Z